LLGTQENQDLPSWSNTLGNYYLNVANLEVPSWLSQEFLGGSPGLKKELWLKEKG